MRKINPLKVKEKKLEILRAAARCFMREGLQGASISKICHEARMRSGHLYYYFAAKEDIIEAMAELYILSIREKMQSVPEGMDLDDFLVSELHREQTVGEPGDEMILLDLIAQAPRNPRIARILESSTATARTLLEEMIRKGQREGRIDPQVHPSNATLMLLATLDAAKIAPLLDPSADVEAVRQEFAKMLRGYLGGAPAIPATPA